ncbi:MAG: phenylacetate--CoA ligase family protein, partial [Akkermansiaceae bacterium]|nr:phenylacetate--CoA ligase family protein [Akkermansiaceae bacterium]
SAHGIRPPKLREVRTLGEIVTPQLREPCREEWGLPLDDMYTSQEFGYIALQCPDCDDLHVQAENVLVEILDDAGQPCAPGETGRVVVTGLQNFAMPLIRYEIGDHAVPGGPCGCGRGLPVLTSVLGRTRNMLVTESGEQRWPVVGYTRFREIAPIRQLQAIQKSFTALHVRVVVESPLSASQEEELKTVLRNALAHPFEITLEYLDRIPPGKSGKFEQFKNELTP